MPVTRTADRDQRILAKMLVKLEAMIEAVRECLQAEEDHGDESHAG